MHRAYRWTIVALLIAAIYPGIAAAEPDAQRQPPPVPKPGEERGVFATVCRFSHEAPDDPIVSPGQPGRSHLHTFFGNATTSAASNYESLRAGTTTCRTSQDASGYWVPALYRNGVEVKPTFAKIYYRTGRHDESQIQAFPPGFRVVAGDATATAAQGVTTTFWRCQNQMTAPSQTPLTCPADAPTTLHVRFPECWDGVSVDSPDHKSHMAYGTRGTCPADHPVPVPSLTLIVHYPITGEPGAIALASGSGYSAHADFFNAWDQSFLTKAVADCLKASARCGVL